MINPENWHIEFYPDNEETCTVKFVHSVEGTQCPTADDENSPHPIVPIQFESVRVLLLLMELHEARCQG